MKKLISILSVSAILLLNLPQAFASFTDVTTSHQNATAIEYLEQNNILEGYADGSFRPNQPINRVEFLKIVLEGSNVKLDQTKFIPFSDIDHTAWYIGYLKKAYGEGWIQGYSDNTFRPEQTINKVEALKIIGKVQAWNLSTISNQKYFSDTEDNAWYTPYVRYAKEHGLLEETGTLLSPDKLMSRANISEIIYRSFSAATEATPTNAVTKPTTPKESTTDLNSETNISLPPAPEQANQNLSFKPHEERTYPVDFFENVTLSTPIPNTFYQNELYIIEANINSNLYKNASVLIENEDSSRQESFTAKAKNNTVKIPVYFNTSGNQYLGMIPGSSGTTKLAPISVLPEIPTPTTTQTVSNTSSYTLNHSNDSTYINILGANNTLKKITLSQGSRSITYINRQNEIQLPLQYKDFFGFQEGNLNFRVDTASISTTAPLNISSQLSQGNTKSAIITKHQFSQKNDDEIYTSPPEIFSANKTISFTATVFTDTKQEALIIKPDGFIDSVELSSSGPLGTIYGTPIIKSGGTLSFNYTPPTTGTYIVEINNTEGIPSLNHPIYIANGIPLIPDYFDYTERKYYNSTFNITNLRNELLQEINKSRNQHGLKSISLASDLSTVAQAHSQDMATNNFFAHINPQGQTPNDRRLAAGIETPVSENLAKDVSIKFAHEGLMRSAGHRQNILTPEWERVGIGIAEKDGYLHVTEEFATNVLTQTDLQNLENDLVTEINLKRTALGLSPLTADVDLKAVITYLNDLAIQTNEQISNSTFSQALNLYNIGGTSEAILRTNQLWKDILTSVFADKEYIYEVSWKNIAVDVQTDSTGVIRAAIITNR